MCSFGYQLFSSCTHRLIKLASLCQPVLFDAALMVGPEAIPCPERIYSSFTSDGGIHEGSYWQLCNGYCPVCSKTKPNAIDRDIPLDQFVTMAEYSPILPRSTKTKVQPSIEVEVSGQADNKHPYVRILPLGISWYQMLGVEDQITVAQRNQSPIFNFKGKISLFDPRDDNLWKVKYAVNVRSGQPLEHHYLFKNGGLTELDREFIFQAASVGKTLQQMYGERFAQRGMDWNQLSEHAIKLPEVSGGPDLSGSRRAKGSGKFCEPR